MSSINIRLITNLFHVFSPFDNQSKPSFALQCWGNFESSIVLQFPNCVSAMVLGLLWKTDVLVVISLK